MGVVRGEIALIPVGPLPLAVSVIIAPVVAVANIKTPALLPVAV